MISLRRLLFPICLCCISIGSKAQGWFNAYNITPFTEYAADVAQTPDGGFVMVGNNDEQPGFSASKVDVVVVKVDVDGAVQWSKVLNYTVQSGPSTLSYRDFVSRVMVMPNGDILLAGTSDFSYDNPGAIIWRLDAAGNLLSAEYGGPYFLEDYIELPNGYFFGTGTTPVYQGWGQQLDYNLYFGLHEPNGHFDITTASGGYGTYTYSETGLAAVAIEDRVFVLEHAFKTANYSDHALYVNWYELTPGQPSYLHDDFYLDHCEHPSGNERLFQLQNNSLVASYNQGQHAVLKNFTLNGQIEIWRYERELPGDSYWAADKTTDNGFIMAMMNESSFPEDSIQLIKLDMNGTVVWENKVPLPSNSYYLIRFIKQTADQGFIIGGDMLSSSGAHHRYFLVKTDAQGNAAPGGNLWGLIQGNARQDTNADCLPAPSEPALTNWIVKATNGTETYVANVDTSGQYRLYVTPGNYTLSLHHISSPLWSICNNNVPVTVATASDTVSVDFAAQQITQCALLDVQVTTNRLRPCIESHYTVSYQNLGTATATAASITVGLPANITIVSASLPFVQNGNTLSFDLGDIPAGSSNSIGLKLFLDCAADPNDTYCVSANLVASGNCAAQLPSFGLSDSDCRHAVAPFDPNDKSATPVGNGPQHFITEDTVLSYRIRFQNTGTDTAYNVVLRDTLSRFLDPTTLLPGAASHAFTWELLGEGILKFNFEDIMLPDSNANEPASHGFVEFQIKPKTGTPPLSVIENKAAIYFDYTAPVITNTVFHTIEKPVVTTSLDVQVCQGTEYQGTVFNIDTILVDTFPYPLYDSVAVVHIDVLPTDTTQTTIELCQHEFSPLTFVIYDDEGVFAEQMTLWNQNGCDSLVMAEVVVHPEEFYEGWGSVPYGEVINGDTITEPTTIVTYDTTEFGCKRTWYMVIIPGPNAIGESSSLESLVVSPNPFNDAFTIRFKLKLSAMISASISDALGNTVVVMAKEALYLANEQVLEVSTSDWPSGIYFIRIQVDGQVLTRRVVKR